METIRLYRRRYVPDEITELKDDKILMAKDDIIVTNWNVLKPRKDIDHGISIYYIEKGLSTPSPVLSIYFPITSFLVK